MEANLDGVAIEYEDGGCGPAVMVLHDDPSGSELRGHFIPLVQAGYRVILSNLGVSDGREQGRAAAAVALLNYLGVGRAVILGISRGGQVLLELMETYPRRVAAGSLVVGDETVLALRRSAGERGEDGNGMDAFRKARLSASSSFAAPVDRRILPAWVERIRVRVGGKKDLQSLLAAMDLPPLLAAASSQDPPSGQVPTRSWRPIRTLNGHLAPLLDALFPRDEESDEEILSDRT
ncbi:MAG TPA: alpha/beta hydrolase [Deferrimonas sp.]|jgi:pimeloyl-ACP methyl ester carboxylesterase